MKKVIIIIALALGCYLKITAQSLSPELEEITFQLEHFQIQLQSSKLDDQQTKQIIGQIRDLAKRKDSLMALSLKENEVIILTSMVEKGGYLICSQATIMYNEKLPYVEAIIYSDAFGPNKKISRKVKYKKGQVIKFKKGENYIALQSPTGKTLNQIKEFMPWFIPKINKFFLQFPGDFF